MNREQKAAVIDEVAMQISESEAVFAIDYRGISVPQAAQLRQRLEEADATLRVVKNTLTERAADKAGAEGLKALLEGPTAFMFVKGDAALAAKAIATFRREHQVLEFKGGTMDGATLSIDELEAISRLPALEVLHGQMVGVLASPITGLVRGLNRLIQGLATALGQIAEQGLVSGEAPMAEAAEPADPPEPAAEDEAPAPEVPEAPEDEAPAPEAPEDEAPAPEAPEDEAPAAEAAEATASQEIEAPPEGEETEAPPAGDEPEAPPEGDTKEG